MYTVYDAIPAPYTTGAPQLLPLLILPGALHEAQALDVGRQAVRFRGRPGLRRRLRRGPQNALAAHGSLPPLAAQRHLAAHGC